MASNKVTLNQTAGANSKQYLSYGDMTVVNNSHSSKVKQYLKLTEEFEKELDNDDIEFVEFIDKIQHFTTNIDSNIIGLKQKLIDGGFEADFEWAQRMKQYYFMKLTSNNLSKATQKIHAYILARVCVLFNLHIKGAINDGVEKRDVRDLIMSKVIDPLQEMLGENNVLDLYEDDITAMIYFLTGNCHIRWK